MKTLQLKAEHAEEITALWNAEIGKEFPLTRELFIQNSVQDDHICPEASFAAIDEKGCLAGFLIAKTDALPAAGTGYIQVLLVAARHRRQGIGSLLLKKAESVFIRKGICKVRLGSDFFHYFPGVPLIYESVQKWFEARQYVKSHTVYDLINEYADKNISLTNDDEIEYMLLNPDEEKEFLLFMEQAFPGRWTEEAALCFRHGGNGKEIVILRKNGKIVGFCRINGPAAPLIAPSVYWASLFEEPLGGIGPLGIEASERKNGYGLGIVTAAIHYLLQSEVKRIVIDWTMLIDFYGKLGYKPWKGYVMYHRELS